MPESKEAVDKAANNAPAEQAEVPNPADPVTGSEDSSDETNRTFDAEYVSRLRAEAAKYRTAARDAQAKAKKFDEIEASNKTEIQKSQEAAEAARNELEKVRSDLLRSQIANAKKLPSALAERLRGSTAEEMEADADALLAELEKRYVNRGGAAPEVTGAGVTGKAPDYASMSPKELVKMVRDRDK